VKKTTTAKKATTKKATTAKKTTEKKVAAAKPKKVRLLLHCYSCCVVLLFLRLSFSHTNTSLLFNRPPPPRRLLPKPKRPPRPRRRPKPRLRRNPRLPPRPSPPKRTPLPKRTLPPRKPPRRPSKQRSNEAAPTNQTGISQSHPTFKVLHFFTNQHSLSSLTLRVAALSSYIIYYCIIASYINSLVVLQTTRTCFEVFIHILYGTNDMRKQHE